MATFNSKTGQDFQNAHHLATACQLAYLPEPEGKEQYKALLGLDARLISVDNTQVYVAQNKTDIVVAFRGSEQPTSLDGFKDWLLTNAKNFLTVPEGRSGTDFIAAGVGCRFHRGFMDSLEEVWAPLFEAVDSAKLEHDRPVWVTGHSLGGAIALLAAWRLERNFVQVHQVYTFGAPMIGNAATAAAFQKQFPNRVFRCVDSRDLVPKLPTLSLFSNEYGHCLTEILLGPQSTTDAMAEVASKAAEKVMSLSMIDEVWQKMYQGVDCHLMPNYLDRIKEQLKSSV